MCNHQVPKRNQRQLQVRRSPFYRAYNAVSTVAAMAAPLLRGPRTPPTIRQGIVLTNQLIRYVAPGGLGVSDGLKVSDLLNILFFATAANAGTRLFSAVRLKKISIYGLTTSSNLGSNTGIGVSWNDQASGATDDLGMTGMFIHDAPTNVNDSPVIHTVPPARTEAAMWQSGSDSTAFLVGLTCPPGSYIDLTFDAVFALGYAGALFNNSGFQAVTGRSLSGLTTGQFYYSNLSGGNLRPVVGQSG